MIQNKKIAVVLPAYNAEKTLRQTYAEIPFDIVDEVILVDDCSLDDTLKIAGDLNIFHILRHDANRGYGGNQKTCYDKALELQADIIVMLHPDYQYTPKLIAAMCSIISNGVYPVVFGSRILGKGALKGGMPFYKYVANRFLTLIQNLLLNQKLSEYHTGFRAYHRSVLESLDYQAFSEDFIFDNQMVAGIFAKGFEIGEITCPTRYFPDASSISFGRSITYGINVIWESIKYFITRMVS